MSLPIARRAILVTLASLAAPNTVVAGLFSGELPADLELSFERRTEAGLYTAALVPVAPPVKIGRMHAWSVHLTDSRGRAVDGADIAVDGGMPQHGHGLPTAPVVTQRLGDGRYLVEGMKFNMRGWWEINLGIRAPAGSDSVTFNLIL